MANKKLSEGALNFLDDSSCKGWAWLKTKDGRDFLQQEKAVEWLLSPGGKIWLCRPMGEEWLSDSDCRLHFFLTQETWSLLELDSVKEWLTNNDKGRHWLATGHGFIWLSSEQGQKWLNSVQGQKYLKVPKELLS